MPLINGMIRTHRLFEFVNKLVEMHNEEEKDKTLWDVWLHRVFDKSYNEFMEALDDKQKAAPTQEEVTNIVVETKNMLNGFVPVEVKQNGTISSAGYDSD
jgi:hypothetical protein